MIVFEGGEWVGIPDGTPPAAAEIFRRELLDRQEDRRRTLEKVHGVPIRAVGTMNRTGDRLEISTTYFADPLT